MLLVVPINNNVSLSAWWIVPIVLYVLGGLIAAKSVNPKLRWWKKVLFVIFWPFFFIRFLVAVTAWSRLG